jgi:hypothetical protein
VNKLLTCHNVGLAHSTVHTIHDNADRIKERARCLDSIKYQQSERGSVSSPSECKRTCKVKADNSNKGKIL